MKRLVLFPYTFVLMNWAAVAGLYHAVRGTQDIWSRPVRGDGKGTSQVTAMGYYQVVEEVQSKQAA
jgi:hypothetical protein